MNDTNSATWFFSPPVGPSISSANLEDVLCALAQDDEYWSIEAPATADDYCRENWAQLVFTNSRAADTIRATIFYVDHGLFTIAVQGPNITAYPPEITVEERKVIPSNWFDSYPVVSEDWESFSEVSRQGDRYRYPAAVLVDREQLTRIVRRLLEARSLDPNFQWIMEMRYAQRYQRWFYVEE